MASYFLFGIYLLISLIFKGVTRMIFGSPRYRRNLFFRLREILLDIQAQHGGEVSASRRSRFDYVFPDKRVRVQVSSHSKVVLRIFVQQSLTGTAAFYKVPRMLSAFLESFVPVQLRMENTPYFGMSSNPAEVLSWRKNTGFENLMESFSKYGFSLRMDRNGLVAWKTLRFEDVSELELMERVRKLRLLAELCSAPMVNIPVHEVQSEKHCAYCKEVMMDDQQAVQCVSCGTPHHNECFQLNGRCTVFGCNSTRSLEPDIAVNAN